MLRKLRPRSAYDVMAAIAFFIAVAGGTAYAAATITGDDVVDESLTGADIKGHPSPGFVDGTLTSADIKNKSLLSSDIATNTLTAGELGPNSVSTSELKDGSVTNAKLAPGKVPDADKLDGMDSADLLPVTRYKKVLITGGTDIGGGVKEAAFPCDSGDKLVSGGFEGMDSGTELDSSEPGAKSGLDQWVVRWRNDATADTMTVVVLCADFPPLHT